MQKSKHPNPQTAIANKIKKWVETAIELSKEKPIFAISITRLTSIKSLCQNEIAAQQFALYLAREMEGEGVSLRNFGSFYVKKGREGSAFKFNPSQRLRKAFGWSSTYKGD